MRLGEVLVARGAITEKQLKKGLEAQLIFGAHLGTCLIELGYIDEDSLGNLLSEILGVKYAHRDLLLEIPASVTRTLTAAVAEKHRAVPFELTGKTLKVAMVDPRSLSSLDDLSFVSGCRIEAWISPEVRIMQAIERYYDVPRRLRYITLAQRLDNDEVARKIPARRVATRRKAAVATIGEESMGGGVTDAAAPPRVTALPSEEGLARAAEEFCRADDAGRVAKITLNFASRGMARSILFSVKGEDVSLWESRGISLKPGSESRGLFHLTEEPVFGLLYGEPSYRGPIPDERRFDRFFEVLGIQRPAEALILSVHLHDRLVVLFYGDGGPGGVITGETEEYNRLISKLALAIDLLMLKKKIHAA